MKSCSGYSHRFVWTLLLVIVLSLGNGASAAADLAAQRSIFKRARQAQISGDFAHARRVAATLKDYPLMAYLTYEDLRRRLGDVPPDEMLAFLREQQGSYLAERLRTAWLPELARKQHWSTLRAAYRAQDDLALQCHHLRARLQVESIDSVAADILPTWQASGPRGTACDEPFAKLYSSSLANDEILWDRVVLAVDSGDVAFARSVAAHFAGAHYRDAFARLLRATVAPQEIMRATNLVDSAHNRAVVITALTRLARQNVDVARTAWAQPIQRWSFSNEDRARAARIIALAAVKSGHGARIALLDAVPARGVDVEVQRAQLREAIVAQAWAELVRWTELDNQIPDEALRWRYWRARALGEVGRGEDAKVLLAQLAGERDYYGFLAADRLNLDYQFHEVPITATRVELDTLQQRAGLRRAREFELTGLPQEAAREWNFEMKQLASRELQVAAVLASQWQRPDRAILALGMANAYDDLPLRFPLLYTELAHKHAARHGLDPARVMAIIRAESAFNPGVRSPVGALGLMQLMPATGRETARRAGLRFDNEKSLLEPATNIALGTVYLHEMLKRYDGNFALAAAAYNAGPGRVRQWQGDQCIATERWVETIPFTETRGYVRRALFYAAIYQRRLERPIMKLQSVMLPIPPRDTRGSKVCTP